MRTKTGASQSQDKNNMYRTFFYVVALLNLTGCTSSLLLTETDCRADAAQWTWRGEYDAVQGDQPWIEAYAKLCGRYGVEVNAPAYLEGWDVGHAAFERRVNVGI